jgi:hypothetical protein
MARGVYVYFLHRKKRTMSEISIQAADKLTKWLNSPGSNATTVKRVKRIVVLVQQLNDVREKGAFVHKDKQGKETVYRIGGSELAGEIEDLSVLYPYYRVPVPESITLTRKRQLVKFRPQSLKNDPDSVEGCGALNDVTTLLEHGELWRVKSCRECGRYFQASRRRSAWCSEECERTWKENDEEFRVGRAEAAANAYWTERKKYKKGAHLRKIEELEKRARARRHARRHLTDEEWLKLYES